MVFFIQNNSKDYLYGIPFNTTMPLKDSKQSIKQGPMSRGAPDDFQTPGEALWPLIQYLKKDWVIWEPAAGKGKLVDELWRHGYKVIASDILDGHDFLTYQPEEHWDCLLTNPPFSLKQEFLERCYALKKPFALLLPLTTFETPKRQKLFRDNGVQVIFFDKRINFTTPSGKGGGAWFAVAWFGFGLNLPKELNFVEFADPKQRTVI